MTATFIFFNSSLLTAQDWPRVDIAESGCSARFPSVPEWDFQISQDSSYLWLGEVDDGQDFYGIICVEFYEYFMDASEDELIAVAEDYLDYLQKEFGIVSHTGYLVDYSHNTNDYAVGVSDSWVDDAGDPWEVKAWIDHFNLAVMYLYGDSETFSSENSNYFFDSFWFPE
jgi:hypothetical protein